jgi:hypothetical protein
MERQKIFILVNTFITTRKLLLLKKPKRLSQLVVAVEIFTVSQEPEAILRRNIDTNTVVIR